MSHETPDTAQASLDRVAQVRGTLSDRVRLPAWYQALYTVAATALFVVPALVVRPHHHLPWSVIPVVTVAASVVIALQNVILRGHAKVHVAYAPTRTYPGTRVPIAVALMIVVGGSVATWLTAEHVSWGVSLACGLVSVGLLTAARQWTIAAVRRDIRTGRAVAR